LKPSAQAPTNPMSTKRSRPRSIIRDGSRQAETAMSGLDTSAQDIVAMIHGAVDELSICGTLTRNLQSLTRTFTDMADAGEPMIEDCIDHPVVAMMDTMGRSYTMASERVVHDRFLLPGMEPLCKAWPRRRPLSMREATRTTTILETCSCEGR
jgi:hypothetical protein